MSTLRYGTSKENIVSMRVVTCEGRVLRTRRNTRKNATGYELNALYIGAEGTLGVITELTVRTFPRPKRRIGAVVTFADVKSASEVVVEATSKNLCSLLRCELLNDEGVRCTNAVFKTNLKETTTLFLEFISAKGIDDNTPDLDWAQMEQICHAHGSTSTQFAPDAEALDALWDARRGCYLAALKYRGVVDGSMRKGTYRTYQIPPTV
jgi:D-lactate dehydrogenase (cytochrome)|tara:strand:- start:305 stop:928 length:624 start_codon:yes stop_codon:yes gene_type:complete